jgi:hypothetical protein
VHGHGRPITSRGSGRIRPGRPSYGPHLTAARTDGGVVFVDGNRRAVAIYEAAGPTPMRLPI